MKYIYNLKLNFNNKFYEFYEWKKEDILTHIKKIPAYKITDKDMYNLKYNYIKIDKEFFKNKKNIICIFFSNNTLVAIKFNNK